MITLEDILISSKGEVEKIYRGKSTLHFWRGLNLDDDRVNPLYPDLEQRILPSGSVRDPDVEKELKDGVWYVKAQIGKGTSIVDKEGIFGYKKWEYLVIPAGTTIPKELIITKDHYMQKKKCWHYSISPNFDMSENDYLKALDVLALNAGIKIKVKNHANNR
ncbi:Tse2 family ADP-ribosyltransferase toxin [Vibrio nigripulchritudo]|uniref:Tse2 family ADP-ribosyltransferase toxin n=1 Tax=Vibrio nigripulchritudo TaxID=28173 RepID=UPI002490C43E|nr:hypothetical protein [Vibrio nigripulchritudo]BDU39766.1 hypothetical protein TUMSATVNIG2_42350 [Vibrio nigripulchritudo]